MSIKHCLNWKVIVGLGLVALGIGLLVPSLLGRVLPLLLVAACPLSMLVMMWGMGHMHGEQPQGTVASTNHHDASEPVMLRPSEAEDIPALRAQVASLTAERDRLAIERARTEGTQTTPTATR